jgi:hypothetical protein
VLRQPTLIVDEAASSISSPLAAQSQPTLNIAVRRWVERLISSRGCKDST